MDLFVGTFLDPCWTHVGSLFVANRLLGLHLASPRVPAVSLDVFCYPGGAISGSWVPFCSSFKAICCSRAPFLASVWHLFARFRGQLYIPQFFSMLHIQTRSQLASSLVTIKVSHRQSEVSRKYVAKNALLAHGSCRAKRGTYV